MRSISRRYLAASLLALPVFGARMRRRLAPGDESGTDASFAAFYAKLRKAAGAKNMAVLRALSVPDLTIAPEDVPELERALSMGAARFDKGFSFPYFVGKFPDDIDPYEHAVVINPKAVFRSSADADAPVKATLDFDIVHIAAWRPNSKWQLAERMDGVQGYVVTEDLRTCGHFHGYCERRGGTWKLIAFDEGD